MWEPIREDCSPTPGLSGVTGQLVLQKVPVHWEWIILSGGRRKMEGRHLGLGWGRPFRPGRGVQNQSAGQRLEGLGRRMSCSFLYPLSLSPVSPSQGNVCVYFSLRTLQLDEMVGRHHQFNGHEFEQTPGDGEGQGSLACCSPQDQRVRHNSD